MLAQVTHTNYKSRHLYLVTKASCTLNVSHKLSLSFFNMLFII